MPNRQRAINRTSDDPIYSYVSPALNEVIHIDEELTTAYLAAQGCYAEFSHQPMTRFLGCYVKFIFEKWPGPRFNIKMTSYQYRKSHCGDKMILWPSYLHNGISYTGKMTSLY